MSAYLLYCYACDDVRYVTSSRAFCSCERSSARLQDGAIVLAGPGRIFEAGDDGADIEVVRPEVAVAK
jgi:hypothetical protein